MDKQRLIDLIVERLSDELATLTAAAAVSKENATGEESRAEDQYDTRALESSYLAEGQGKRIAELQREIAACQAISIHSFAAGEPIALGAYVEAESRAGREAYLLAPCGGGMEVACDGHNVLVITPQSPLGRRMLGQVAGGTVMLDGGRHLRVARVE